LGGLERVKTKQEKRGKKKRIIRGAQRPDWDQGKKEKSVLTSASPG